MGVVVEERKKESGNAAESSCAAAGRFSIAGDSPPVPHRRLFQWPTCCCPNSCEPAASPVPRLCLQGVVAAYPCLVLPSDVLMLKVCVHQNFESSKLELPRLRWKFSRFNNTAPCTTDKIYTCSGDFCLRNSELEDYYCLIS